MKTHKVLDLVYHQDEGQDCFAGTRKECEEFIRKQTDYFMYKVVPMSTEEIEYHKNINHER